MTMRGARLATMAHVLGLLAAATGSTSVDTSGISARVRVAKKDGVRPHRHTDFRSFSVEKPRAREQVSPQGAGSAVPDAL